VVGDPPEYMGWRKLVLDILQADSTEFAIIFPLKIGNWYLILAEGEIELGDYPCIGVELYQNDILKQSFSYDTEVTNTRAKYYFLATQSSRADNYTRMEFGIHVLTPDLAASDRVAYYFTYYIDPSLPLKIRLFGDDAIFKAGLKLGAFEKSG
jgi:hypothetical protein